MSTAGRKTFVNGRIFTSNDQMPEAEAMTVEDGRILMVGKEEDLPENRGTVVDLQGRRVIPGFVDAHMHPVMLANCRKKITVMPPENLFHRRPGTGHPETPQGAGARAVDRGLGVR